MFKKVARPRFSAKLNKTEPADFFEMTVVNVSVSVSVGSVRYEPRRPIQVTQRDSIL